MLRTRLALATAVAALTVGAMALLPAAAGAAHQSTAMATGATTQLVAPADNAQWG